MPMGHGNVLLQRSTLKVFPKETEKLVTRPIALHLRVIIAAEVGSLVLASLGAAAQAPRQEESGSGGRTAAEYLKECLRDWDADTHMSRQEWARTCQRVVDNRAKFMREQGLSRKRLPSRDLGLE